LNKEDFSWKRAAIQRGYEPEGREIAAVRSRYQATTNDDTGKDLVWFVNCRNSDNVVVVCTYDL
jgi:hypothetical protein